MGNTITTNEIIDYRTLVNGLEQYNSEAEYIKGIAPNVSIVPAGIKEDKFYFSMVCSYSEITEQQIRDIKEKTRVYVITEKTEGFWKIEVSLNIY